MKVDVVPHSPRWRYNFQEESLWIRSMFSPSLVGIHHIDSTAIPGIYAKPVIDMPVEVTDIPPSIRRMPTWRNWATMPWGIWNLCKTLLPEE